MHVQSIVAAGYSFFQGIQRYKALLCLCMPTGVGIKLGSIVLRFTSIYDETLINRLVKPQQISRLVKPQQI